MGKSGYVKISDAIADMRNVYASGRSRPFSIVYLELDIKRKKGGRVVTLKEAELANPKRSGRAEDRMVLIKGPLHPIHVHIDLILYVNDKPIS